MVVALACVAPAFAARAGHWKVAFTKAGQAAAAKAVLLQSDLGAGWTGSGAKPNLAAPRCAGGKTKSAAPVAIGAAKIDWTNGSHVTIKSQAVVLRTAKMVGLDWKHTVAAPQILSCTRKTVLRTLPKDEKLVSLGWQRFPHVTKYTREARAVLSVSGAPAVVDFLVIGSGRDELTLTFAAPGLGDGLGTVELFFARKLVARTQAS